MKAFQYDGAGKGLVLKDLPIPEPKPDEVQIRVLAAGICHSDCHIVAGHGESFISRAPITLGHEVAGVVEKLGSSVNDLEVGTRVAVINACHPISMRSLDSFIGLGYDGGFAQYAAAPRSRVIKIPDDLSCEQAAVATDALSTSFHAVVQEAGAAPGVKIGIIGLGGLGMPGLRVAALKGAEVYGFDVSENKFAEAMELGAKGCFKTLAEAEHVPFDAVVDFFGASQTTAAAVKAVRVGGKVVGVGLQSPSVTIPTSDSSGYILKTVTITGSVGASAEDVAEVLSMLQSGALQPRLIEVPFSDIPETLALLSKSAGTGRYWTNPSKV